MDCNKICQPPHVNQSKKIADEIRAGNIIHTIVSSRMLLKKNIEQEAYEKNINILNINSMVNNVWDHQLTNAQRDEFEALARSINAINQNVANVNGDTHIRMNRINNNQEIEH